jgi:hypothetical protein
MNKPLDISRWRWSWLLGDLRWAWRYPPRLWRALSVCALAEGRYIGRRMDWWDGPIWCFGFYHWHLVWWVDTALEREDMTR